MDIVFWISVSMISYIYVGYPCLVALFAWWLPRPVRYAEITPQVTLIIPAYNEEQVIVSKLENSLQLEYPTESLHILVVSDGSTDATVARVREVASATPGRISLIELPHRQGKITALNTAVGRVESDIVVFSDASSVLETRALLRLVRDFNDTSVGCVCGFYKLHRQTSVRGEGERLYMDYETRLKRGESQIGSILGSHGAFYGIRRSLYQPLARDIINEDFMIPMQVVEQGYRAVYQPRAMAWEEDVTTIRGEFDRRIRITTGNYQQMWRLRHLLHPRHGFLALQLFSHKVLRTTGPWWLMLILFSSLLAVGSFYRFAFTVQCVFYSLAFAGYLMDRRGFEFRILTPPFYFAMANLAAAVGFWRFVTKQSTNLWERPPIEEGRLSESSVEPKQPSPV